MNRPRLLVVEDDEAFRNGIVEDLQGEFELFLATCQTEAFERLNAQEIDLVLLDRHLPVTPGGLIRSTKVGDDVLREIRRLGLVRPGSFEPLPVVLMTAHDLSWEAPREALKTQQATDFIGKAPPWTREQLIAVLCGALHCESSPIHLAFDSAAGKVWIETLGPYTRARFDVLEQLRLRFVDERTRLEGVRAVTLSKALGIHEQALRQRILRFRREIAQAFRERLGRTCSQDDIVQNPAIWKGYRLNPAKVKLVDPPPPGKARPRLRPRSPRKEA